MDLGEDLLEHAPDPRKKMRKEDSQAAGSIEALLQQLDRDWKLGLFENPSVSWDLVAFQQKLIQSQASVQDWIDLGIAFLAMEGWEMASRWFSHLLQRLWKDPENRLPLLNVTALFVRSLMHQQKFFEALSEMQRLLQDDEIEHIKKIELFYLTARIYEALGQGEKVQLYDGYVMQMDPHYRDMQERSKKK